MKKTESLGLILMLGAGALLGVTGCNQETQAVSAAAEEAPAIHVTVQTPASATVLQHATFAGRVSPDETVAVLGKLGGTVAQTHFEVGDTVRKGQVLYTIDPSDIQLTVDQAKIAYETTLKNVDAAESGSGDAFTELQYKTAIDTSQQAYERARDNLDLASNDDFDMFSFRKIRKRWKDASQEYDQNQTPETWSELLAAERDYYDLLGDYTDYRGYVTAFESAYTNYENALEQYEIYKSQKIGENRETFELQRMAAENAYQQALQKLSYTTVTAPIDGVIEEKNVAPHAAYNMGAPAYIISNKSIVNVEFAVSADIARAMQVGDPVEVESGSTVYQAEIVEIGNAASSASGLFTVKARMEDGSDLFTGISVKLTAITARAQDALTIPLAAVYYDQRDGYVYVERGGLAVKTPVELGISDNESIVVLSGLSEGDRVITSWNPNLTDQVAVTTAAAQETTAAASKGDPASDASDESQGG